ncbi:immune inhibitor A domain-containing protein [Actinokineospora sp. HUAS TT18]|uniref:immune inhibitor A domain-containing protein n=1 Tax=Actinokineospora sp. HUAS TT18 TaxID=3447451 RepID=UPI003F523B97
MTLTVGAIAFAPSAVAEEPRSIGLVETPTGGDELPNVFEDERRGLRQKALSDVLAGRVNPEKRGQSTVAAAQVDHTTAGRQYAELNRTGTDKVFVLLVEFGNERHASYPDRDTNASIPGPERFDGPVHNEIPEPDRAVDNTTPWQADYSREHFENLLFGDGESLRTYYERQSSGRYSIEGTVTDWVKVKYNEARYGRSNGYPCPDIICTNSWALVIDGFAHWVDQRRSDGWTEAQIRAEVTRHDVWDRYDADRDGEFNEPDGYIDHLQIVHAGGDQADGDINQGEDAIWSHHWYAFANTNSGPAGNRRGGTQIGDTGIWVGDYTMQPENGGLGVIAHEFGHDLGLPDHYDRTRPADAEENSVNWWSLMGQTRFSGEGEAVGTRAGDLSAWDKLQLGWLDHEVVHAGDERQVELGAHEVPTGAPQGVVVVLPPKEKRVYGEPFAGDQMYWSGKGDNLQNTASVDVDLRGRTSATLKFKARYDIEGAFDFLYVQASVDGGSTWTALNGTINYPWNEFPRDRNNVPALHGSTGGFWADIAAPMNAFVGHEVKLRFRYVTNQEVALSGFFADDIQVESGQDVVFYDGAEGATDAWELNGFRKTSGTELFDQFYVASYRTYEGYGNYRKTGPFNHGMPDTPKLAEHFPYQDGLLVSYWDTSQLDNNVSQHPGEGLVLPVDANPEPIYDALGLPWRPRIAGYDAPFSLEQSDSFTLHSAGRESLIGGRPAQPVFDDLRSYWSDEQPTASVKVRSAGVGIDVLSQTGSTMGIRVFSTR